MRLTGQLDPQIQKARLYRAGAVLTELITIYAVVWGAYTAIAEIISWLS